MLHGDATVAFQKILRKIPGKIWKRPVFEWYCLKVSFKVFIIIIIIIIIIIYFYQISIYVLFVTNLLDGMFYI